MLERRCLNVIIIVTSKAPFAILKTKNIVYVKEVVVHELSSRPTDFWKRWTKTAKVMRLQVTLAFICKNKENKSEHFHVKDRPPSSDLIFHLKVRPPSSPPEENKLRFVCMADTHSLTSHLKVVD